MHGYGGVDQLFYEDGPEPKITQPDEVIVQLEAAAAAQRRLEEVKQFGKIVLRILR